MFNIGEFNFNWMQMYAAVSKLFSYSSLRQICPYSQYLQWTNAIIINGKNITDLTSFNIPGDGEVDTGSSCQSNQIGLKIFL